MIGAAKCASVRSALAAALVLAGMANASNMNMRHAVDYATHIGQGYVLVLGLAFVAPTGSYSLRPGVDNHKANLTAKSFLSSLDGVHDNLNAFLVHQVYGLADNRNRQIVGQAVAQPMGYQAALDQISAFEGDIENGPNTFCAIGSPCCSARQVDRNVSQQCALALARWRYPTGSLTTRNDVLD